MIRVAVIEDSALYQRYLKNVIDTDPLIELCASASNGNDALRLIRSEKPDVISLDLNLPDVHDFDLLKQLVAEFGIPIIVVTSNGKACEEAVKLGAADFMEKIDGDVVKNMEQFSLLWRLKIKMLSVKTAGKPTLRLPKMQMDCKNLVAIGASLGGTEATLTILKDLPKDMPGIVVVQHMPEGFTNAYATRLNRICSMQVVEATDRMEVENGKVIIAKGGEQLTVHQSLHGYYVRSKKAEKVSGFCPSVDVLFDSVAKAAGSHALGVILTGIGRDGAVGMKAMHDKGAYTIGQDEATCTVYGMPAKAKEAGAVDRELPLGKISGVLMRHFEK